MSLRYEVFTIELLGRFLGFIKLLYGLLIFEAGLGNNTSSNLGDLKSMAGILRASWVISFVLQNPRVLQGFLCAQPFPWI